MPVAHNAKYTLCIPYDWIGKLPGVFKIRYTMKYSRKKTVKALSQKMNSSYMSVEFSI